MALYPRAAVEHAQGTCLRSSRVKKRLRENRKMLYGLEAIDVLEAWETAAQ
jgi:hypothetical protein